MKVNVWNTIRQISKERSLKTEVIVKAIEESLLVASQNYFSHNEDIQVHFNPEKGELRVFTVKTATETPSDLSKEISLEEARLLSSGIELGQTVEIDLPAETLGRIAAQAAKQVIVQKVRDAEQEKVYSLFVPLKGKIVTGVLRRFEANNNMILESDKAELLLLQKDKLPNEEFIRGDRIRALVTRVYKDTSAAQVLVSRTDPRFLAKLMENETPEISRRNIEIIDVVREPGERAKVAVFSRDPDIDAIGACIGVKGNRILSISKELRGEKIDIVIWSDNPLDYAKSALSPAKINNVIMLNRSEKLLQAQVPRDQYSIAIGKKGTNVRLASRLVGWKIEIKKV